ncbi:MAG: hypothetical protein WC979_00405 [Candidatus Pacearchaeota archaeon]|jgi:hypothetical protein|nr:hypothetical protein [Clostridia bacterium]
METVLQCIIGFLCGSGVIAGIIDIFNPPKNGMYQRKAGDEGWDDL